MATRSAGGKSNLPRSTHYKTHQPMNVAGGLGMQAYKSGYRAPTVQTSRGYTSGERTAYYGGATRRPAVPAMPAPTGTEAVVRPGYPAGQVVSNVVRERPSPAPRARATSAPAPARRGVAPGTGGRMTKAQRDAPAGPTGRSTGRIGVRTGGVAPGTGGRMTKAQRDAPAGPRGGGGGRVGTRTGGVAAGTGGRQTKSQRDAPAGPRGTRM